jgi:hypothetical protein
VALVLASNAPDIDIVATARGAITYMEWHRGLTHGPLGIVALAATTAGVMAAGWRISRGRWLPFAVLRRLAGLALIAGVCHVLMDLPTSYGTRLLSPFSWRWFAADWMPIVDIYLLVALASGLYFGMRVPNAAKRNVVLALLFMAANYGLRGAMHHRALTIAPQLFGITLPPPCRGAVPSARWSPIDVWPRPSVPSTGDPPAEGRCLVEMAAMPSFLSPFEWRVIARSSNGYELQDINVLSARYRTPPASDAPWRLLSRVPSRWTPAALAAAGTRTGQVFLGFSRFPVARTMVDASGATTVRFTDVRFLNRPAIARGRAGEPRAAEPPSGFFAATIRLDPSGRVIDQHLGY